jgi:hypothetical protein
MGFFVKRRLWHDVVPVFKHSLLGTLFKYWIISKNVNKFFELHLISQKLDYKQFFVQQDWL